MKEGQKDLLRIEPVTSRFQSRNCTTTRILSLYTFKIVFFSRKINWFEKLFVSDLLFSKFSQKLLKRRVRNLV